ncbi:hypothetical protein HYV86_00315 [Candidatus Woesearchaeota archaeon]|nr:hypothetical protein [Candidatus Woesearchaeota archaeon]
MEYVPKEVARAHALSWHQALIGTVLKPVKEVHESINDIIDFSPVRLDDLITGVELVSRFTLDTLSQPLNMVHALINRSDCREYSSQETKKKKQVYKTELSQKSFQESPKRRSTSAFYDQSLAKYLIRKTVGVESNILNIARQGGDSTLEILYTFMNTFKEPFRNEKEPYHFTPV